MGGRAPSIFYIKPIEHESQKRITLSQILKIRRCKGPYEPTYRNEKLKLENSKKITESYTTAGKLVKCAWKDTIPNHRHFAAMKKMIKHFLADYWKVGRTYQGLPTPHLYVQEKLGHTNIVQPEERGWVLPES